MFSCMAAQGRVAPRIIELVGPPGSGKSTIAAMLRRADPSIRIETFPYFRTAKHAAFFAWNALRVLPDVLRMTRGERSMQFLPKRDIALLVILTGWNKVLARKAVHKGGPVLLDEGPVCLLAKLRAFGSAPIQASGADRWWQKTYSKWNRTVDAVIVLDTPVPVLLNRVRARGAQFEIEKMSDDEAYKHLARIRRSQDWVIQGLTKETGSPGVIRVSTLGKHPEKVAQEIMALIGRAEASLQMSAEAGLQI